MSLAMLLDVAFRCVDFADETGAFPYLKPGLARRSDGTFLSKPYKLDLLSQKVPSSIFCPIS